MRVGVSVGGGEDRLRQSDEMMHSGLGLCLVVRLGSHAPTEATVNAYMSMRRSFCQFAFNMRLGVDNLFK